MDPKRLHLHFGQTEQYNNDRNYSATNGRIFPTTPSTFPQPIFPSQDGQTRQDHLAARVQSPGGYGGGGAAGVGPGYFPNVPFQQQQYNQQLHGPYQGQTHQPQVQTPQPSYQQRPGMYNGNDPNSGLARQFSYQNLGSNQRQTSPFGRQPSPRPRTAGTPGHYGQQNHGNNHTVPLPSLETSQSSLSASLIATVEEPPEKDPEKFSSNVSKRAQGVHSLIQSFYTQAISRARERNKRALELETLCDDPRVSEYEKKQKTELTRKAEAQYLRFLRTKEKPSNFSTLKTVGKGAFGEVRLVQRKTDGKIYALKSLVKTEMFKKDQLAHVRAERDVLVESDSPWVVKLYTTFQDRTFLYMLMEFLPGGDLMTMLIKYEIFSEDITRFYMAELVLAIDAVHKMGYVHRDIKPDNILLDRGGHIKLTDFGLSTGFHHEHDNNYYQQLLKGSSSKSHNRNSVALDQINLTVSNRGQINGWRKSRRIMAYSTVGTPDYIAPEIFGGKGYSYGCDWWSVGAIMFECLVGWPPFCAEDPHDTYRKIVDWRNVLCFPDDVPLGRESEHLVRSLLCDVSDRLGTSSGDIGQGDIRNHPFFRGVIWENLRKIRAPFEPKLSSNVDVSYFPTDEIDQSDSSAAHRAQVAALGEEHDAEMNLPFIGYTYKRFDALRQS